jgi:EAL domain-containing protein (putative c-di-GMP-specific phosphodiesterase class I)
MSSGSQKGIADRLIGALQEDEFVLYYQTIKSLSPEAAVRPFQEIFVRFKEEDMKLLPPGTFFPILEEFHLMPYLDRWVINRLARWVRGALAVKSDWEVPRSTVNLSPETLVDPHFPRYVRQFVEDSYLSHGALGFEMTWENAVELEVPLKAFLADLRPFGCFYTLAGFDGSETSFEFLERLVPDFVRLGFGVVNDIGSVPAQATRLAEVNLRCDLLGVKTIAESVESESMIEELKRTKTHFVQGFAVSEVQPLGG